MGISRAFLGPNHGVVHRTLLRTRVEYILNCIIHGRYASMLISIEGDSDYLLKGTTGVWAATF